MASSDEKKDEPYTTKMGDYLIYVVVVLVSILFYYGCSGLILYACKIAQSSVLPDNNKCYPYEDTKPTVETITTDIFTTLKSPQMSKKLEIPYDKYNSSNTILDWIRSYKNSSDSYFLVNYLMTILESTMLANFSMFGAVLNKLNLLPELLLVLIGPIIYSIVAPIIFIIDSIYFIYLWFAEMGWFFKDNTNNTGKGMPKWEDISALSFGFRYATAIFLVILFIILFIFTASMVMSFYIPGVFMLCIFSIITFRGKLNGNPASGLTIIKETYIHYKVLITSIFTFIVTVMAFNQLGTASGIVPIVIAGAIYFGIIAIDIYKPVVENGMTPVINSEIAKKTCDAVIEMVKPKSLLDKLNPFSGGGQSEKGLKKQLIQLGKKLSGN